MGVDVTGVKGPYPAQDLVAWGRSQLEIARSILDNPGGGLLFALASGSRTPVMPTGTSRWFGGHRQATVGCAARTALAPHASP